MLTQYEEKMTKTVENLEGEYATIRAGRANPNILNKIKLLPFNRILRHGAELQLGFYPVFLHADAFIKYQRNDHRYFDRC